MRLIGKGYNQAFTNEIKVTSAARLCVPLSRQARQTGDVGLVVKVLYPSGQAILTRSVPVVYAASTTVKLAKYPGWGKLDVTVAPLDPAIRDIDGDGVAHARRQGCAGAEDSGVHQPAQTVRFETKNLATGTYEVATRLMKGSEPVAEDRQPYEKKPLPEWYHCKAGIIDGPPIPWTDVRVRKKVQSSGFVVECLLKEISFRNTLFPAEIVSNGKELLAGPVRLRVKRGGMEKVIEAGDFRITDTTSRRASWTAAAVDGELRVKVDGWIEFDGFTWATLTLAGGSADHLALEIPLRRDTATLTVLTPALIGNMPRDIPCDSCTAWFGNEKAGLQTIWDGNRAGCLTGSPVGSRRPIRRW